MDDKGFTQKEMLYMVLEKQKTHDNLLSEIKDQTTKTNGRVNAIEPTVETHTVKIEGMEKKLYWATGVLSVLLLFFEVILPRLAL